MYREISFVYNILELSVQKRWPHIIAAKVSYTIEKLFQITFLKDSKLRYFTKANENSPLHHMRGCY